MGSSYNLLESLDAYPQSGKVTQVSTASAL